MTDEKHIFKLFAGSDKSQSVSESGDFENGAEFVATEETIDGEATRRISLCNKPVGTRFYAVSGGLIYCFQKQSLQPESVN